MNYSALPQETLVRVIGGMLTTYYRDKHPAGGRLRAVHQLQLSPPGSDLLVADVAIIAPRHNGAGQILAIYEVVSAASSKDAVAKKAQRFVEYLKKFPTIPAIEFGIVAPESREAELRATLPLVDVVTYPG